MTFSMNPSHRESIERNPPSKAAVLAKDALCGTMAALLIAPIVTIIDKAIFTSASGKEPLSVAVWNDCKAFIRRPYPLMKSPPYLMIWGVFTGTFVAANTIENICNFKGVHWGYPKFLGTSATNVTLSVLKDVYFTKTFGIGSRKSVPFISNSLYTIRDSMTVFSSFILPPIMIDKLTNVGIKRKHAEFFSQLVAPSSAQLVSTPLHLLGIDVYNRPIATISSRIQFIKTEYVKATTARISRIVPAFGVGGIANRYLRRTIGSEAHPHHQLNWAHVKA